MARPSKKGLEYFPLDVDIRSDDKIYFIESKYGIYAFAIIITIYMKIYRNSYYCEWSEKEALMLSRQTLVEVNVINNIINDSINENIFSRNLFEKYSILTSKGIQARYFEACSRRKEVQAIKEFIIANLESYTNIVYVNINPVNEDINTNSGHVNDEFSTQSKVKKKESKEKQIITKKKDETKTLRGDGNSGTTSEDRLHSDTDGKYRYGFKV